ncbi:MAG TPA: Gfo/Idh/MocA family oxidoreductase [Vicinamibacteria bacterium]|nr:Gfo/Idh/MocA family oxidoreductase [Vicinamibacteria bacterium]
MTTRRRFLATTGAGLAGAALGSTAASYARILGANDRVRVGLVGFAIRTKNDLLPSFLAHAKEMNFDIVAVSDLWRLRREEALADLEKRLGHAVAAARNNDELYDRKDVDAVMIATSDFQHARHAIEAVQAGRDVYVEKPLANTMKDARDVRAAVKASDRVVQVGTQRRSGKNYRKANEFIRSGKFGPVNMVEMSWNVNQPGRWRRPKLVAQLREEDTDWGRFLIDRPKAPFNARHHLEYRLFWPYSSGIPDQWMVHQIDTVHWFTGLSHPRSVVANGGIYQWQDGRTNFDTMTAVFDYGPADGKGGFQVVYSSRMGNEAGGIKEVYYSNGGALDLDRNTVTPEGGLRKKHADEMGMAENLLPELTLEGESAATSSSTGADNMTSAHVRNWMECVRSRKAPNADIEAGYQHSLALCMTIAALHTGKRVTFDDGRQDVVIG